VKIKKLKFFFLILCILQVFYIFHFRSGFKYEVFKSPFKVDSGVEYSLSKEVIESSNIIKKNNLKDFNLSQEIKDNMYLLHRIVEFNYPIRMKEKSKFIFLLIKEKIPFNCKILKKEQHIKLAECSNV